MIYCPKALEEKNHFIRQRMLIRRWHLKSLYFFFLRALRGIAVASAPYFHDWFLSARAARWYRLKKKKTACRHWLVRPFPSSLPFREVFFGANGLEGAQISWLSESRRRGGSEQTGIPAQWYHAARFFHEEELDEGEKYILILTEYCAL